MKTNYILIVLLVSLVSTTFGQTSTKDLLPIKIDGLFGFINKSGEVIIEPKYAWVADFSEGLAVVKMPYEDKEFGDMYGYIDSTGQMIISPVFDAAGNFMQGWARVKQDSDGFIYIDKTGRMPIAFKFFECYNVQSFPIPVREKRNSKAGYVNRKGEYVIEAKFDMARPFIDDYAVVAVGQKRGYIDTKGDFIIQPQFYRANYFNDNVAKVIVKNETTGDKKEGYINKKGEYVVEPIYKMGFAKDFSEGVAAVSIDGQNWGFINTSGMLVIPAKFEKAASFSEGLAKVCVNGKYGFIDKSGNWVIQPKYENVSNFKKGIASVYQKNERMGYINQIGKFVWRASKPKKKEEEKSPYDRY
ncbi:MAG: WG repeat-containing protein [Saprospiraceae bacterium]